MPKSNPADDLEVCRNYVRVLARRAMEPSLRTKVDESDVAQEVLVKAHRLIDQFRGSTRAELLAWLREILKTTLCDVARNYHRAKRDVNRERSIHAVVDHSSARLEGSLASACVSPSVLAATQELSVLLSLALEGLPPQQREAVELHYLVECTFSQVADRMGLNRNQAAGLIRRGVEQMRRSAVALDLESE